ncbi:hypothetical protein ABT279_22860 [Amycolatopsis sp. NPDC000673]
MLQQRLAVQNQPEFDWADAAPDQVPRAVVEQRFGQTQRKSSS